MNDFNQDRKNKSDLAVESEVTLRDIVLKFQEWWVLVLSQRVRIITFSLLAGGVYATHTHFFKTPTYVASYQLFFEEEAGVMSGAMRLASSFGLSLGSGGATSSVAVQEYLTSRDNIAKVMIAESSKGILARRYYAELLKDDSKFSGEFNTNFGRNQRYTDSILSKITYELNKKYIAAPLDKESGTVDFIVNGDDEAFVFDLSKALILNTEVAFLDDKKQNSQRAVDAFQFKVDSLEKAIDATLQRLGEYEDQNISLVNSVDKMKRIRLTIDMEALKLAYGEYIKALEMSKAELMNLKPPFKYFDAPTYPLYKKKKSTLEAGILGLIISGFSLALFFILRREAKILMAD